MPVAHDPFVGFGCPGDRGQVLLHDAADGALEESAQGRAQRLGDHIGVRASNSMVSWDPDPAGSTASTDRYKVPFLAASTL